MVRILLIEDNELNRDMLSRRLERRGHEVLTAATAFEGLELAESSAPALVLMDLSLPGMDGLEATRRLKANPRTAAIPVIALTAHALIEDRERALAAGCVEFDTKPVEFSRLMEKIARFSE
jgi:CheY-like chemotaxis protein